MLTKYSSKIFHSMTTALKSSKMMSRGRLAVVIICGVVIIFLSALGAILAVKTVASSSDADKWIKIGQENAHHDLDKFEAIAANLASGSTDYSELCKQLDFLQKNQITEAADNNRLLIPKIIDVIEKVNGFLGKAGDPEPSIFSKMGLRALIWYVDGIRDNKSYYLLDGAQLWASLRMDILKPYRSTSTVVNDLAGQLELVQNKTISVRDQLDGLAQIFVAGIKKIHTMTDDIGGHLEALRGIATELLVVSEQKTDFLENTVILETNTSDLVDKYCSKE